MVPLECLLFTCIDTLLVVFPIALKDLHLESYASQVETILYGEGDSSASFVPSSKFMEKKVWKKLMDTCSWLFSCTVSFAIASIWQY